MKNINKVTSNENRVTNAKNYPFALRVTRYFLLIAFVICHLTFVIGAAQAAYYYPQYWISGKIVDPDSKGFGMTIYFYEFLDKLQDGSGAAYGTAGNGNYMLNAGSTPNIDPFTFLVPGVDVYHIYIPNSNPSDPANGYGADKMDLTLSGNGIDYATLKLTKGSGKIDGTYIFPPKPGTTVSIPPAFEYIKFGDRIYQKDLVQKALINKTDYKFIVPANPKISAKVNSTIALNTSSLSIKINSETTGPTPAFTIGAADIKNLDAGGSAVGAKSVSAKAVTALSFAYDVPDEKKLGEGANTVKFYVEDANGVSTYEIATVTVMSGPAEIIGPVLTFPSPFSPTKDRTVTVQYTLSTNADIDVYVFSPTGETVKKFILLSGTNGGTAGVNKITWDGVKPTGATLGNAIYSGVVVSHAQGKILKKFMLTVVD